MKVVKDNAKRFFFIFQNKFYFHYVDGAMLIFNTDQQKWTYYEYDQQLTAPAFDDTNKRFLVGTADKNIRQIEDVTSSDNAGNSISFEVQSKDFTLQTRRHFPRWIKYDVELTNNLTATVKLDGVNHQNHTLSQDRRTKRRLVKTGNGRRLAINISGSGTASIFAVEAQ